MIAQPLRRCQVEAFGSARGTPGLLAGRGWVPKTLSATRTYCGRLDADGQHLASELKRMLELVASGKCDVAVGSRFLPESGTDGQRYKPTPERLVGTSLLRKR